MCHLKLAVKEGVWSKALWAVVFVWVGMVLALPRPLSAQVLFGSLVGNVTDQSGAAVPDATVKVTQAETGFTRSVVTNQAGVYDVSTIPAGTYTVEIAKAGFKTFRKADVPVTVNTVGRVDAALAVGSANQTVEVSGSAAVVQTDRADVHQDITATEVENVPMAPGNNFEQLFVAVPGINPPTSAHSISTNPSRALSFNSNGTSQIGNDIRIDGVTQINIWVPENAAYIPSSDAIQEVNVSTNSYTPEQGLAGGSSVNVQIKSGTNRLHGDVYEFNYVNALEANGFFNPDLGITRVPKDIFNQFGGSVGGPIKRDKLFFFGNTEFTRQRTYATRAGTVPTASERAGDLRGLDFTNGTVQFLGGIKGVVNPDVVYDPTTGTSDGSGKNRTQIFATDNPGDPNYNALCTAATANAVGQCFNVIPTARLSAVTQKLLALLPMPNIANEAPDVPNNNYLAATDFSFNRWSTDDKIDWNASDKFRMNGHLGILTYNDLNPQMFDVNGGHVGGQYIDGFGGNEGQGDGHTVSLAVTATYVATPNLVIDGTWGMTRMVTNSQQLDLATDEGLKVGIAGSNGTLFGAPTRSFEGSWPEFDISGFSRMGTYDNFMPYFRNDPQFNYAGNASWIHAKHTVRFGADFLVLHLNQVQPEWNGGGTSFGPQGGFNFRADTTQCANCSSKGKSSSTNGYNDMASFLMGLATNYGENFQVPDKFHTDTKEYSLYVGDTWQATRNLTVNAGVRWEYYPVPTRTGGLGVERYNFSNNMMEQCGTGGIPIDCGTSVSDKLFAPRVGLAYRFSNTWVVRAGYGITNDPFNLVDALRTNYPILVPFDVSQPHSEYASGVLDSTSLVNTPAAECTVYPAYCINGALPVGIASTLTTVPTLTTQGLPGNVNLITTGDSLKRGYIQSWNFTLEKQFGGWLAQAGYVATRTTNFLQAIDTNAGSPIGPAGCTVGTNCGGAASEPLNSNSTNKALCPTIFTTNPGCRTGTTYLITPIGDFHYDSLQATLNHEFSRGYMMQVGYTFSKSVGLANVADEKQNDGNAPIENLAFFNLNHGLSRWDRPQKFNATFVAQPPFGAGRRWATTGFASRLLGGWQLSGLLTVASGLPFELTADGASLNAPGNAQRPDLIAPLQVTNQVGPGTTWFNTAAFAGVTGNPNGNDQRFGTSAFYELHGPRLFNLDAALFRNFKFTERWNLQVRAQAINLTNTPYFNNPDASCGSYATPTATNPSFCSNSAFGQIGPSQGTNGAARDGLNARQFEFNVRLMF